jgi:hypothetical protein
MKKYTISKYMDILPLSMGLFMGGALVVVVVGGVAMAANGKLNKKHSNKLMRLRILLQAIAIVFFVIIVWFSRN